MLPALRDLHANLAWLHDEVKAIIRDLAPEQLDWKPEPAPEANSIAQLVAHICDSERYWLAHVVGGEGGEGGEEDARDREAAFAVAGLEAEALCELLDETLAAGERALERLAPADLERDVTEGPAGPVTAMGPIAHALEHTAIHTGHIEMMRDLLAHPSRRA